MDKIFETGTLKIFSQLSQNAISVFDVDARRVHFDTTSVSVYGDYDLADPPFQITYSHSKAKRPAVELLQLYKGQIGIEKNFSFLKDPAIVNSIFLKKAERIEVPGLILLISLLVWRLMERSMRQYVEANDCTLTGWERRPTKKPTSFMMTTKFAGILVITTGRNRQLARPLKDFQREYLKAMGVSDEVFTVP